LYSFGFLQHFDFDLLRAMGSRDWRAQAHLTRAVQTSDVSWSAKATGHSKARGCPVVS